MNKPFTLREYCAEKCAECRNFVIEGGYAIFGRCYQNDDCPWNIEKYGNKMSKWMIDLLECRCKSKYSIEPHGNGYALYHGRCMHKHGANILHITECSRQDILKWIVEKLNGGI